MRCIHTSCAEWPSIVAGWNVFENMNDGDDNVGSDGNEN